MKTGAVRILKCLRYCTYVHSNLEDDYYRCSRLRKSSLKNVEILKMNKNETNKMNAD